jgi:short-chain Z-isoprenyl diphosphate synthase
MLSIENLRRPQSELEPLFEIIKECVNALATDSRRQIVHLGNPRVLPMGLARALRTATLAAPSSRFRVVLAIGYSGRDEIVDAARLLVTSEGAGAITQPSMTRVMQSEVGPPDLIIRSSGELRSSGFLLWSAVDALWYFAPRRWPEFNRRDLRRALRFFGQNA